MNRTFLHTTRAMNGLTARVEKPLLRWMARTACRNRFILTISRH